MLNFVHSLFIAINSYYCYVYGTIYLQSITSENRTKDLPHTDRTLQDNYLVTEEI